MSWKMNLNHTLLEPCGKALLRAISPKFERVIRSLSFFFEKPLNQNL